MGTTPNTNPTAAPAAPGQAPNGGFEVSPAQGGAQISFIKHGVQPPSNLYVLQDDQIAVIIYNSVAGAEVDVSGRILEPSGRIVPFYQQIFPAADSAAHTTLVGLAEGFLLNVVLTSPTVGLSRGQCFAEILIARGSLASLTTVAVLAADYVYPRGVVGWPNGRVVSSVEGVGYSNVALLGNSTVSAGIVTTIPAGQVWLPRLINFAIITGATVANRQPQIVIVNGGETLLQYTLQVTIPASTIVGVYYAAGIGVEQTTAQPSSVTAGLPEIRLYNPTAITGRIQNFQTGDSVQDGAIMYDQWIAG